VRIQQSDNSCTALAKENVYLTLNNGDKTQRASPSPQSRDRLQFEFAAASNVFASVANGRPAEFSPGIPFGKSPPDSCAILL